MRLPIIISHHCICDSIPQDFPLYLHQNLDSDKGLRRRLVRIYRYYLWAILIHYLTVCFKHSTSLTCILSLLWMKVDSAGREQLNVVRV